MLDLPRPLAGTAELQGQVAIVTGGSGSIARRLGQSGATVVLADLSLMAAEKAAQVLEGEGIRTFPLVMDASDEAAVETGIAQMAVRLGRIDILVSNGGIQIVHPIEDFPLSDWRKTMTIRLDGAFLTTRACLKQMYPAGRGSIFYIRSVHSKASLFLKSAYVNPKHGLIGLAKVVAKEGAKHGVRANVVCPGFVRTLLIEKQIPEQAKALGITEEEVIRNVTLRETVDAEFTTVEDVAEAVHFFAAAGSNALTGQSLIVSHGWCMQ